MSVDRSRARLRPVEDPTRGTPWVAAHPQGARLLLAAFTALALAALMVDWRSPAAPVELELGSVAPVDVRAAATLQVGDPLATEERQRLAREEVPPVFAFDAFLSQELRQRLSRAFGDMRAAVATLPAAEEPADFAERLERFERQLGVELRDEDAATLLTFAFPLSVEEDVSALVKEAMSRWIVLGKAELPAAGPILVARTGGDAADPERIDDLSTIVDVREAAERISIDAAQRLRDRPPHLLDLTVYLARELVEPNLRFDATATEGLRDRATEGAEPVVHTFLRGQIIVREGEVVSAEVLRAIAAMQGGGRSYSPFAHFAAMTALLMLCLVLVERFAERYVAHFRRRFNDLAAMNALLVLVAALAAALHGVGEGLGASISAVPASAWTLLLPVSSGAIILRTLLNAETAAGWSLVASLICAGIMDGNLYVAIVYVLASLAGAGGVESLRERSWMLVAGLRAGAVGLFVVLVLRVVAVASGSAAPESAVPLLAELLFALLGGVVSGVLALGLAPLFESFGFLTEARLMELASLNHPLLREMIVKAPGTYHHSMMVGVLGEAAAEAVGANSLLVRVGAYFHDIGKMGKAQYFIENQRDGENPHDKLAPSMSALVIHSHVKDGIELGHEHKLPSSIIDLIPQHHGTSLVSYFYNKAMQQADPDRGEVRDTDYRYPGPKPLTREAGIMMLADAVEAATRSLKTHTPGALSQRVEQIVNRAIADGQLDECPMTLWDLRVVSDTFVRVLLGIYHSRIEYPAPPQPGRAGRPRGLPASSVTLEVPTNTGDLEGPHPLARKDDDGRPVG